MEASGLRPLTVLDGSEEHRLIVGKFLSKYLDVEVNFKCSKKSNSNLIFSSLMLTSNVFLTFIGKSKVATMA